MAYRTRIYYSSEQRKLIWDKYKQGMSLHNICSMFDRTHSSMMKTIYATGGYRPTERTHHPSCLSLSDQEEISRGLAEKLSMREIARRLDRSPSTVSREVNRNGGLKKYRANKADKEAWENAKRPKPCKVIGCRKLCAIIELKLKRTWSPQQIAGWLTLFR